MQDRMTVAVVCFGVLLLVAGCVTTENAAPKGDGAVPPEPGTRAFYEQNIRGVYVLDGGELVRISVVASTPQVFPPTPPGVIRARPASVGGVQTIEGRVLQVLSNNLVVVSKPVTNASGVVAFPRSCLVVRAGDRPSPAAGSAFRALAVSSGWYTYQDGTGSGTLTAYREVLEPTYEEYRQIYERDCRLAVVEPIVSVARVTNTAAPASMPAQVPPGVTPVAIPVVAGPPQISPARRIVRPLPRPAGLILGDYTYVTNAAGQASITGFNKAYTGALAITNDLGGFPVTSIRDNAFLNCTNLTSVTIHAGITDIGGAAFAGCNNLTSILVDVLNPVYSSTADGVVFNMEKTRLVCYPQGKTGNYTIPGRVTNIGSWAFRDCVNLTGVTIPSSVIVVEGWAFWGCSNLTSITIPASVTRIEGNSFAHCGRLNAITVDDANQVYSSSADGVVFSRDKTRLIRYPGGKAGDYATPTNVTGIEWCAFEGCLGLTGVTIPTGVTTIESCTFKRSANLALVVIPDTVTSIGGGAFDGCLGLTNVTIPTSVTSIGGEAFSHCSSLSSIAMPDKLTGLGGFAFWDCTNLTSIMIPGGVTRIEGSTFQGCRGLADVTICDGVTNIGYHAFAWCSSLTNITIPASVTGVGSCAFRGCTGLTGVQFKGNAPGGGSDRSVFCNGTTNATVYYLSDTTGWGGEFGGRPTMVWDPTTRQGIVPPPKQPAPPPVPVETKGGTSANLLQIGDPAPPLLQGRYVQGEPVSALESGKVYVVEFWATWCGPCRTAIPHLNQLHEKFKDRGLVVIGQNVWERGTDVEVSVTKFVEGMGSNMTYRVALDRGEGNTGAMAETWMRAAGRKGIPSAFVVNRTGIVAWMGHPMSGLDGVVEKVLAGSFDIEKAK